MMAISIKFDSVEIRNTTYAPRYIKHESIAERLLNTLPLTREDGEVLVSEKFGVKVINLIGYLTGTSQANLEANIDTMKELFCRLEKNLDVDWNGSTLRFVATCQRLTFNRDHYNNLFVPWAAEFVVLSGEGKDTTATVVLNEDVVSITTPGADDFTFAGSKPPKPKITIKGANFPGGMLGIEYKNTDTGEKIVITAAAINNTDSVIIDTFLKKVTANFGGASVYTEKPFYGVFPSFIVGLNNVQISGGALVNQQSSEVDKDDTSSSYNINDTTQRVAQSFSVPYTDATFQGIIALLTKTGAPGAITWRIETDNGDEPSGTLADANATGTIAAASVGARDYVKGASTNPFTLNANTKYWLVLNAAATLDGSNFYSWSVAALANYTRGRSARSFDSGGTWDNLGTDMAFKILYGGLSGAGSVKHSVEYTKTYL